MRKVIVFECMYCGHTKKEEFYYEPSTLNLKCSVCKEAKNIRLKEIVDTGIFGYRYSPDFPEKSRYDKNNL